MDRNIISQTQIDTTIKNPVSFLEVNINNCKFHIQYQNLIEFGKSF